jgi:hypothetical protein
MPVGGWECRPFHGTLLVVIFVVAEKSRSVGMANKQRPPLPVAMQNFWDLSSL